MDVTLRQAAKNLIERWDEFNANDATYEQAYNRLAKYAREDWEALRTAVYGSDPASTPSTPTSQP